MTNTSAPENTALVASSLCQECGLCCGGAMHSSISVSAQEIDHLKKSGIPLRKSKSGKVFFVPPCVCLHNNTCTIHATKPAVCRDYHCILQLNVMNGSETFEKAVQIISTVKQSAKELVQQVNVRGKRNPANLNLRNFLFSYFDEIETMQTKKSLTPKEQTFIYDAFEYAKLIDRYFIRTRLLPKYADLILKFADKAEATPVAPNSSAKP